jgi:hypothetical protein
VLHQTSQLLLKLDIRKPLKLEVVTPSAESEEREKREKKRERERGRGWERGEGWRKGEGRRREGEDRERGKEMGRDIHFVTPHTLHLTPYRRWVCSLHTGERSSESRSMQEARSPMVDGVVHAAVSDQ